MSRRSRQPPSSALLVISGMFFTLFFHGALAALYLYWHMGTLQAREEIEPTLAHFEPVELLMWGEVMPNPNELPIIPNPAPEERPEEVVQLTEPEQETVTVREEQDEELPVEREEREEEPEQPRDSSRHNPNRPTNPEPLIGSPHGFRGGTSLSARALANIWAPTVQAIQRQMRPPGGITEEEIRRLQGRVRIFFNADGRILRFSWVERSGNQHFDSNVERAINTFRLGSRRLPLPTREEHREIVEQAIEDGVIITILPPQ